MRLCTYVIDGIIMEKYLQKRKMLSERKQEQFVGVKWTVFISLTPDRHTVKMKFFLVYFTEHFIGSKCIEVSNGEILRNVQ